MQHNNFELRVLVGGKPIHEYEHKGNFFVEGRKGSQFELEFKNNTGKRVLAVPSVDCLSVMDGKPATNESMGYVVPAHGSVRIPGWRLDAKGVASFIFEDKERSYGRSTAQSAARAGVVGVLVFDEKVEPVTSWSYTLPAVGNPPYYGTPYIGSPGWQPYWNGYSTPTIAPLNPFDIRYATAGSLTSSIADPNSIATQTVTANSVTANTVGTNSVEAPTAPAKKSARRVQLNETTPFEMGTGFGPKSDFKTNEVSFNKGNEAATLAVYYDSKRNLEKRGIQVVRTQRAYLEDLPSPFQSTGCTPPPGWNG
jgi:hypothetical protein